MGILIKTKMSKFFLASNRKTLIFPTINLEKWMNKTNFSKEFQKGVTFSSICKQFIAIFSIEKYSVVPQFGQNFQCTGRADLVTMSSFLLSPLWTLIRRGTCCIFSGRWIVPMAIDNCSFLKRRRITKKPAIQVLLYFIFIFTFKFTYYLNNWMSRNQTAKTWGWENQSSWKAS